MKKRFNMNKCDMFLNSFMMTIERGDAYKHGKKKKVYYPENVKRDVIEDGAVRKVVRFTSDIGKSKLVHYAIGYPDFYRIDFQTYLNLKDKNAHLQFAFRKPENCKITSEVPYGSIERKEGYVPVINWLNMSNEIESVCIINSGLPEYEITDNFVFLGLIRGFGKLSGLRKPLSLPLRTPKAQELGEHVFRYSIISHADDINLTNEGMKFNIPLITDILDVQDGDLSREESFIRVLSDGFTLKAVKKAENNNDLIIRIVNTSDKGSNCTVCVNKHINKVYETDLLEKSIKELEHLFVSFTFYSKPFEIKTFRISFY